jgi:hypothetical protein
MAPHAQGLFQRLEEMVMRTRTADVESIGSRRIRRRLIGAALTLALAWPVATRAQEAAEVILRLRGFGLNLTGVGHGRSEDFDIAIERWSTDEERDRLQKALSDGGVAALSRAITDLTSRVGRLVTPREGKLGLKYARESVSADGRRHLVLLTERLSAPATNPHADTHDYLVVEVVLDKDGKGEGRTAGPESLRYDARAGTLELDRYVPEPVRIDHVRVVGPAEDRAKQ